jgi:hypothetical protein
MHAPEPFEAVAFGFPDLWVVYDLLKLPYDPLF